MPAPTRGVGWDIPGARDDLCAMVARGGAYPCELRLGLCPVLIGLSDGSK